MYKTPVLCQSLLQPTQLRKPQRTPCNVSECDQRINKKCIVVQQPLDGEQKKVAVVVLIKEKKGRKTKESNGIEQRNLIRFDEKLAILMFVKATNV